MKEDILLNTMLFHGLSDSELPECLTSLSAQEKTYKKGAFIFHAGDLTDHMGLVLSGSVTI